MGNMCNCVSAAAVYYYMQLCVAIHYNVLLCTVLLSVNVCYYVLRNCVLLCATVRHILHLFAAVAFRDGCTG